MVLRGVTELALNVYCRVGSVGDSDVSVNLISHSPSLSYPLFRLIFVVVLVSCCIRNCSTVEEVVATLYAAGCSRTM